jgi:iron(III) transport system substrate-binding protein
MKTIACSIVALLGFLAMSVGGWPHRALAAPIDELKAGAKKEGVIEFYAPSTLTPQGAEALGKAFNKKYHLNIALKYSPSGNMTANVAKVVGMAATGVPPDWDLMVVTDAHHATLWLRKLLNPFDYGKLGVNPKLIHYDNGAISFANQFVLPAYNKKILPAKDVPEKWEDLLDPKWKGGKLGVTVATHHFARLATVWGEEKTTKFVRAIAAQRPILGRLGEIYNRLQLGEVLVAVTMTDSYINTAKKAGAPVVFAEGIQPVISPAYYAGVLKGAQHPNVGHLFAAFLTSPEAQTVWEKYGGQTSAFIPGTPAYKYAQGKQVIYMTQDQAGTIDKLAREYGKILGFGRK